VFAGNGLSATATVVAIGIGIGIADPPVQNASLDVIASRHTARATLGVGIALPRSKAVLPVEPSKSAILLIPLPPLEVSMKLECRDRRLNHSQSRDNYDTVSVLALNDKTRSPLAFPIYAARRP
jgi:hypothetical protein